MDSGTGEAIGFLLYLIIIFVIWATPIVLIILGARMVIKWVIREARGENKTKTKPTMVSEKKPDTITKENNQNILDHLDKLGQLREKGVLTEEEFQKQKQKILSP